MSVKVRPFKNKVGAWEVDITLRLPDGRRYRERTKAPNSSKSAAYKWGQDRERHLIHHGPAQPKKEVATLEEFAPRFIRDHATANQQKPSGIAAKESILRAHLIPHLGSRKLDAITTSDVQALKGKLANRKPKTVNNALTVLNTLLKKAVEWSLIDAMPCSIKLLKASKPQMGFYTHEEYERLVSRAAEADWRSHLVVLLGGDAGLRLGEIIGLEWSDVDLVQRRLTVRQSEWRSHVTVPKGGRIRHVPLSGRLAQALTKYRHQRSKRVVCQQGGSSLTQDMVRNDVERPARQLNLFSGVHRLRHTFCSHLAMPGVPARAIQELAGHQDLSTTQRYMHLSPAAMTGAIDVLERARPRLALGEIRERATG
jgi:integrase